MALGLVAALRSSAPWFRRPGRVAALYLLGAGGLRLAMEFFRGDDRGEAALWGLSLPPTTWAAALTLAAGLALLVRRRPALAGMRGRTGARLF